MKKILKNTATKDNIDIEVEGTIDQVADATAKIYATMLLKITEAIQNEKPDVKIEDVKTFMSVACSSALEQILAKRYNVTSHSTLKNYAIKI